MLLVGWREEEGWRRNVGREACFPWLENQQMGVGGRNILERREIDRDIIIFFYYYFFNFLTNHFFNAPTYIA
jgi:hypothetical protein